MKLRLLIAAACLIWIGIASLAASVDLVGRRVPAAGAADSTVALGNVGFGDIVVDNTSEHVFVSAPSANEVLVLDYAGQLLATIPNQHGAVGLVINGSTLYVAQSATGAIGQIDLATLADLGPLATGLGSPDRLTVAGGLLWTVVNGGYFMPGNLVSISFGGAVTVFASTTYYAGDVAASPGDPNTLFVSEYGAIYRLDVATGNPVLVSMSYPAIYLANIRQIAISPDGTRVIPAAGMPYEFDELAATTLSPTGLVYPASSYPAAVAVASAHGGMFAGAWGGSYSNYVNLFIFGATYPFFTFSSVSPLGATMSIPSHGVALTDDGSVLFTVMVQDYPQAGISLTVSNLPSTLPPTPTPSLTPIPTATQTPIPSSIGPTIAVGTPSFSGGLVHVPVNATGSGFGAYDVTGVHLRWNPSLFGYANVTAAGGVIDTTTINGYCDRPVLDADGGGVFLGCVSNVGTTTATGLMVTVDLFPRQTGCSPLHLLTSGSPDNGGASFGTFTAAASLGPLQTNLYVDGSTSNAGTPCVPSTPTPGTPIATPTFTPTITPPSGGPTPTPINSAVGPNFVVGSSSQVGSTFRIPISLSGVGFNAYTGYQVHLRWDPSLFSFSSVSGLGGIFDPTTNVVCPPLILDADGGGMKYACISTSGARLATGLLVNVTLAPLQFGCSPLHLFTFGLPDDASGYNPITGTFTISASSAPQQNTYVDNSVCNLPPPTATSTNSPTPTATPDPDTSWAKSPGIQQIFLCESGTNGVSGCTIDGINGTVQFDEVLYNQTDPNGLGAYEFTLHYDNLIFNAPVITNSSVLGSTGRPVTCSMTIPQETQVHWGCASTGLTPLGPSWFGPKVMAHVVLPIKASVRGGLYPHKENGLVSRFDDTGTEAANICGQPLNDGTGYVVPGQTTECQGVRLPGVLPGGLIADSSSFITIRRLEGDIDKDCDVDVSDMQGEATRYGFGSGSLLYQIWYDLEPHQTGADGDIDVKDVQFVFGRFGSTCSAPIPPQVAQLPVDP